MSSSLKMLVATSIVNSMDQLREADWRSCCSDEISWRLSAGPDCWDKTAPRTLVVPFRQDGWACRRDPAIQFICRDTKDGRSCRNY